MTAKTRWELEGEWGEMLWLGERTSCDQEHDDGGP